MDQESLISRRERRATATAALVFTLAMLLGAVLWGNRLRMLFAITHWQDDSGVIVSSSGTISVSKLGCPFALRDDEPASITAKVSNDWTREVGIEVTFFTEDLSNGPPYAYITNDPLCEPVLVQVSPKKTANVTCEFEQKTVTQGMMPVAVKARTVAANFGSLDYDSAACPIWIMGITGISGDLVANLLGLISLCGMAVSGAIWRLWGYFPGERRAMIAAVLLWLAGAIVAIGVIVYVIHEVASCAFSISLLIAVVMWIMTQDRRRKPLRSIYEQPF